MDYLIRTHKPGDPGYVAYRHGVLYAAEYGFDLHFDEYVMKTLVEFLADFNAERDVLLLAEHDDRIVGSIGVVGRDSGLAQLRWFLVEPEHRGRGLGKLLMERALTFCREKSFRGVYLWTFEALGAARHLYQRSGFQPTERQESNAWGRRIIEERWELILRPEKPPKL